MSFVDIIFITALVVNVITAVYAFYVYRISKGGALSGVAVAASLSAIVFGLHHIGEVIFSNNPSGLAASEGIEIIAGLILIYAIYEFGEVIKV